MRRTILWVDTRELVKIEKVSWVCFHCLFLFIADAMCQLASGSSYFDFPGLYLQLWTLINYFFLLNLFVSAYLINAIGKETKTVLYVIFLLLKNIKCYMWLGFSSPLNGVDFISSFIYKDLWWLTLIVNMTGFKITMETDLLACVSGIF